MKIKMYSYKHSFVVALSKKISLAMLGLIALCSQSCEKVKGDGPVVTETRNINNFSGIDLRCSANVSFKQDSVYKVEINAQQNIINIMETYVSAGKLVIRYQNDKHVSSHTSISISVSAPSAAGFRVSGSGSINAAGSLTAAAMDLDVSGSGNIYIQQLATGYFNNNISGSGNITVYNGTATDVKTKISGSGRIDLSNVATPKAATTTSGSGETRVNASQDLNVSISGSGSVYYRGNPAINSSISGSGRVIRI